MNTVEFALPDLGEGLADAEIVEWLAPVGAEVAADQPVVSVETAKAQVELPAPVAGRILRHRHGPGDVVAVGEVLYELEAATTTTPPPGGGPVPPAPVPPSANGPAPGRRVLAAPSTRRLAVEHGVDLAGLVGSGPGGRVLAEDVLRASTGPAQADVAPAVPPPGGEAGEQSIEIRALRGPRRGMARSMTASLAVPHVTEFREIPVGALEGARADLLADRPDERLTLLALLTRIVAVALGRHPELNAHLVADELRVHRRVDLGIATATPDGLIVPVLRDAGGLPVRRIAREIDRLAAGARDRTLRPDESAGATFTVTNFGSYGTWLGTPLVTVPQVGIAGFGRAHDAVVAVDGAPTVRRVLPVAAAADHRVIDGAALGAFLGTVERLVRTPLLLLAED